MSDRDARLAKHAAAIGFDLDEAIKPGANYALTVQDGGLLYVSGQIPRMGGEVVGIGRLGDDLTLEQGRHAARIATVRSLAIVRNALGSLERVRRILRLTTYVQCAAGFTQQSEVSDAASDILYEVFAPEGAHTRTSVGVFALPKNAAVELDWVFAVHE